MPNATGHPPVDDGAARDTPGQRNAPRPLAPRHSRDLLPWQGRELGVSSWRRITQRDIDIFAELTGDDFWLHTDIERSHRTRFGGTIAHGLLTLSLGPKFTYELLSYENFESVLGYGYNRVRFIDPVPVNSEVRMRLLLKRVALLENGAQILLELTFERRRGSRPVCVAENLTRLFDRS